MTKQKAPTWLTAFWAANAAQFPAQVQAHRHIYQLGCSFGSQAGQQIMQKRGAPYNHQYAQAFYMTANTFA